MHLVRARSLAVGLAVTLAFGLALIARAPAASAGKPEKVFGGKILVSDKKFPTSAKSESQFISKLKKQQKSQFWEDKEEQQWKVYFAAFFKKPLADLEYTVKIYDVTGKQQALLLAFEQFTDSSKQTSLISHLVLERKFVGVNKQLLMTIESKGHVVATGRFKILGEAEKFSGKVDFSEDDTKGN